VSDDVVDHLRSVQHKLDDGVLPPHYPTCFGCGPDAEQGFGIEVRREDDEVVATHTFEERHSGAPGIAHGGAVAVVVDDVLGYLLYIVRAPGVTRRLEVDYLKPVLTGVPYVVRGRIDSRDGRKLWVSCACTGPDGVVAFRATGLFIVVDVAHFSTALTSGGGQGPVAP
jgi:acyl-coenzyme A thioesterase PaaI-like protein